MPPHRQPYSVTREDMTRIGRVLRLMERWSRDGYNLAPATGSPPSRVPPGQTVVWFCLVTGEPPGGTPDLSELWEGTLYIPDPDDASNPPHWREEACWLRPLPHQEYMVGQTGTARLTGWRPEDVGFPGVAGTYPSLPIYTFEAQGDNPNETYSQEELNSNPAFTTFVTSEPGADPATSDTFVIQIGQVGDDGGPFYVIRYYPEGTNNDETYSYQLSHNASNQLVSETFVISMNGATYTLTRTPIGETYVIQIGTTSYTRTRTEDEETYAITINGVTETVETISEAAGAIVRAFGGTVDFTGATVTGLTVSGVTQWVKVTKSFSDFAAAAAANTVNLGYDLPAGGVVHAWKIKHSASFTGGSISGYQITAIGKSGTSNKYCATAVNIFQAPGDAVGKQGGSLASVPSSGDIDDHASTTAVTVSVSASGANLDQATAGSVDIWLLVSVAT